jgi:hypothetical protein
MRRPSGNVAATGRQQPGRGRVFRGVKWKPAGQLPGRAARCGSTPSLCLKRFEAADEAADERRRVVDLFRERVVVRRCVGGMRMALNLPVSAFRGVAIRLKQTEHVPLSAIDIVLEHGDPALSLPLFSSETADEIVADWQAWGRVLGLPLLVAERDGSLREPFARLGAVLVEAPTRRRRRRSTIARRRSSMRLRRHAGGLPETPTVHSGEREIIARN